MPFQSVPIGRALAACLLAGVLTSGLAGCGRRGALEAPDATAAATVPPGVKIAPPRNGPGRAESPAPTTLATQQAGIVADTPDDSDEDDLLQSVNPSPTPKRRSRAYGVPKQSFVLDPLL